MHGVVISSIGDPPPGIGVYLVLLTVILGFLCKIGAGLKRRVDALV